MMNFNNSYYGKKVFITGNTGFKGSWLSLWLEMLGAKVFGYSYYKTDPCHFDILKIKSKTVKGNINHRKNIAAVMQEVNPDIVFHLAAMPIVSESYRNPQHTYQTNVMGTLHVLQSAAACSNIKAFINVTTDKVYENKEISYAYKESDPLGGYDLYSSSKACSEILTASFRQSFFHPENYRKSHQLLIASARAGNVIGGGDWAKDRLIPDLILAAAANRKTKIRNPEYTRPWQFVLDALCGYMMLGEKLLEGNAACADAWNFGPDANDGPYKVIDILKMSQSVWPRIQWETTGGASYHEASLLSLDCSKSKKYLHWHPVYNTEKSVDKTICWYKDFYEAKKINTRNDIEKYMSDFGKSNAKK